MPKEVRFPEAVHLNLPEGWKGRIQREAARREKTPAEYIRDVLRRSLNGAERRGEG